MISIPDEFEMNEFNIPLTQLGLEISATVQAQSWNQGKQALISGSHWQAHWQVYVNQMTLETFLPWLKTEYESLAQAWPEDVSIVPLWQVVNGTGITLDPLGATEKRLVLIPNASIEQTEFRVPREWIEIPSWVGDYYLAVAVNSEGDFLRVYGYATHELIRQKGQYDPIDRTYCLSTLELMSDLTALWVVREVNPQEVTQAEVPAIIAMADVMLPEFLTSLMQCLNHNPRMDLNFSQWAAFLERSDRCVHLEKALLNPIVSPIVNAISNPIVPAIFSETVVNLSQWTNQIFDQAWQAIESVMGVEPELGFGFRKSSVEEVQQFRRIKMIRSQSETLDGQVLLMLNLGIEPDGRMGVQISVLPIDRMKPLPSRLQLTMISSAGAIVQSVQSQSEDQYIQLKFFKCVPGTRFGLVITIDDASVTEQFVC